MSLVPPSLEELAGWMYDEDDNPPVITEVDIDWQGERDAADELADMRREAEVDFLECGCLGRDWRCGHYGQPMPDRYMADL
jgi:hypothetical protein